jgi:monoamine oxidase
MASAAVIGAGAAGLSAARALAAAGVNVTVYEARDRVGGRAHTDYTLARHGVELGAEFIHGERVATWEWVRAAGAPTTGAAHSYVSWFHLGGGLVNREAAREALGTDPSTAVDALTRMWVESGREETSLDRVLELWPSLSGRPLTEEGRALLENYVAELASSDLYELGTHRAAARRAEPERLRHFRLLEGYSALMRWATDGLRVRLEDPVERVRWDEDGAEVVSRGGTARFDRVVVTLPLGVLRQGWVEFDPPLPVEKADAVERINTGRISKVVLRFDRVYWPPDVTFLWTPLDTQLWWRPGQGQAEEDAVITAFFGGRDAATLDALEEGEAFAEAVRQLEAILGRRLADRLEGARRVAWAEEPYTLMGYSTLPPRGAGLREALGAPCGALHFAGEATSVEHAATVHGAIESGRRAAGEVLEALGMARAEGVREP